MSSHTKSMSTGIRARLGHAVVDSNGHWREFEPIALDYLRDTAGSLRTPQEALAELDHCKALGIRAVALGSLIRGSIPVRAPTDQRRDGRANHTRGYQICPPNRSY